MTRAKKITYAFGIGAGLCALLADRLLRSSASAPLAAAAATTGSQPDRTDPPAGERAEILALAVTPFPSEVVGVAGAAALRDPFEIPPPVRDRLMPPSADEQTSAEETNERTPLELFEERHQLSAVLRVGRSRLAVLDGMIVTEGQSFDGCELSQISPRWVKFECPHGETILKLKEPLAPTSGN